MSAAPHCTPSIESDTRSRRLCYLAAALAVLIFGFLFLRSTPRFWGQLALSVVLLDALAFLMERKRVLTAFTQGCGAVKAVLLGLTSAAVLYVVFHLGNTAARILFPFGGQEIEAVYGLGTATPRWTIAVLLIFVIGPGEELFWRGYVQRRLSAEFGWPGAMASVLIYGGAHVVSRNLMLILAALVCGAFWSLLYHRYRSLPVNMLSHAAWAVTVFVLCPLS